MHMPARTHMTIAHEVYRTNRRASSSLNGECTVQLLLGKSGWNTMHNTVEIRFCEGEAYFTASHCATASRLEKLFLHVSIYGEFTIQLPQHRLIIFSICVPGRADICVCVCMWNSKQYKCNVAVGCLYSIVASFIGLCGSRCQCIGAYVCTILGVFFFPSSYASSRVLCSYTTNHLECCR